MERIAYSKFAAFKNGKFSLYPPTRYNVNMFHKYTGMHEFAFFSDLNLKS